MNPQPPTIPAFLLACLALAVLASPVRAADAGTAEGAPEWVCELRRDFASSDVTVGFKTVDFRRIRQAVGEALEGREPDARARVILGSMGFTSPHVDHSARETGLVVAPTSVVALDAKGQPDGLERCFGRYGLIREIPWKHGKRHGEERAFEGTNVIAVIPWVEGRSHGVRRTFSLAGVVLSEAAYVNGEANGFSRSYDAGGRLLQDATMENGKREGEARDFWLETGKPKRIVTYKDGKVVGTTREFYPEGALRRETPFKDNAMHGVEADYGPDGKLQGKRFWIDGEECSEEEFRSRGGERIVP